MFKRKNQIKSVDSRLAFFSVKITDAFSRIRQDISASHQRAQATEEELAKLNQWVGYIYHSQQQLSSNHSKLSEKHSVLHNSHSRLVRSHNSMNKSVDLKHSQIKSDVSGAHSLTSTELENIKDWIKHFSEKVETQRDIEAKLRKDVLALQSQLFGVMSEMKEEISGLKTENVKLKEKMDSAETRPVIIEKVAEKPSTPILPLPKEPQFSPAQNRFEEQVLARVRPNRKNFVMQKVLELVEDNKYSTKEVEDMIVKEKQLCGRTSFYSYLRELKHRGKINYADVGDKTILVMVKQD
ncbi:hypothetical protein ACFL96_08930 [Thermoproteota archaeon]